MTYYPNSDNAMFSCILTELKDLRSDVGKIKAQVYKTNGRVTNLEHDKWMQRGVVVTISVVASTLWHFFFYKKD